MKGLVTWATGCFKSGPSDDALVIDCDLCDYSGTQACDDCMVTYLCRADRTSVVVELLIRALKTQ